eukprot:750128-Hanusia_phi.AAC.3
MSSFPEIENSSPVDEQAQGSDDTNGSSSEIQDSERQVEEVEELKKRILQLEQENTRLSKEKRDLELAHKRTVLPVFEKFSPDRQACKMKFVENHLHSNVSPRASAAKEKNSESPARRTKHLSTPSKENKTNKEKLGYVGNGVLDVQGCYDSFNP